MGLRCIVWSFGFFVADADGEVDREENALFFEFYQGELGLHLMPRAVHVELGSRSDLAQEVLSFRDLNDRQEFLKFASSQSRAEMAHLLTDTDEELEEWASQPYDSDERRLRSAQMRGLKYEAFHFGTRMVNESRANRASVFPRGELTKLGELASIFGIPAVAAERIIEVVGFD
jgi:hypothetical protein